MRARRYLSRWIARIVGAVLGFVAIVCVAMFVLVKVAVAPLPGEWTTELHAGPIKFNAGVPSLIRVATAPWVMPLLDGRSVSTRAGRIDLKYVSASKALTLDCSPCSMPIPGMGKERLPLKAIHATLTREADLLQGKISSGSAEAAWSARLYQKEIVIDFVLPATPLRDMYALLEESIPEVKRANIEGNVKVNARLTLPGGKLIANPVIEGFGVSGLGTEAIINSRSTCSKYKSRLTKDSLLSRAVIAAEDQRFFSHPGYDAIELSQSLTTNQDEERIARGGSTITQQVAKMLIAGSERSPVRKLRELLYAVEMEQTLGKARILNLYLANAPWGDGVCGAEAASRLYFKQAAHLLSPAQAAWLAAMLNNPNAHAAEWASSGQIDIVRTQWVLKGIRPALRKTSVDELAAMQLP